jgi:hypothetical protein
VACPRSASTTGARTRSMRFVAGCAYSAPVTRGHSVFVRLVSVLLPPSFKRLSINLCTRALTAASVRRACCNGQSMVSAATSQGEFVPSSAVVLWFWEIVESMSQSMRAKLLQFCTGTARVPVVGFSGLESFDGQRRLFTIRSLSPSDRYLRVHTVRYSMHRFVAVVCLNCGVTWSHAR